MSTKIIMVTQGLDLLSKILEYNIRIEEVQLKKEEIKRKFKSMDNSINSIKEIEIKELEEQSNRLKEVLKVTSEDIALNHINKEKIINSIDNLNIAIMDSERSMEDKQLLREIIQIQSHNLNILGEQGIATLKQLADTTQKAIIASNEKRGKFSIPSTMNYIGK